MYAKKSKCRFDGSAVEYLGHIVSSGVAVDQEKIQSKMDWPLPRNLKALRGFFVTCYYMKFIKGYSTLAATLTGLTKKMHSNGVQQPNRPLRD